MTLNLTKKYPELLEIMHLNEHQRIESLRRIFNRDIQDNPAFQFRTKQVRPIKIDGQASMDTLFNHLIKEETEETTPDGKVIKKRSDFEKDRAMRLHWIKHHINECKSTNMDIFSYEERIKGRGDVVRTYIFDMDKDYVIVLEPQRSKADYYLITAYYLNKTWGKKQIMKKHKDKLKELY